MANQCIHNESKSDVRARRAIGFRIKLTKALLQYGVFLGVGMTGAALLMLMFSKPLEDGSLSFFIRFAEGAAIGLVFLPIVKRPLMRLFAWYDEMKAQDSALSALFRVFDSLSAMMTGESPTEEAHKRA
jgi:hypothetical protein